MCLSVWTLIVCVHVCVCAYMYTSLYVYLFICACEDTDVYARQLALIYIIHMYAACCRELQCVAVCFSVVHCVARQVCAYIYHTYVGSVLQSIVVCCSVLQCVAV